MTFRNAFDDFRHGPTVDPEDPRLRLDRLTAPVGDGGRNERLDVAKVESLLGARGYLDLDKTEGPTGYAGVRLTDAVKRFQKDNGLKVDGRLNPDGETIGALAQAAPQSPENGPDSQRGGWLVIDPTIREVRTPTAVDQAEHGIAEKNEPPSLTQRALEELAKFIYDIRGNSNRSNAITVPTNGGIRDGRDRYK